MLATLLALTTFMPFAINETGNQGYATVRGTVASYNGAAAPFPIAGATIVATSDSDVETVTSKSDGSYVFLSLLPGVYTISAVKSGYVQSCRPLPYVNDFEFAPGLEYRADIAVTGSCS